MTDRGGDRGPKIICPIERHERPRPPSFISELTCDIQHVSWEDNVVADHLSWQGDITPKEEKIDFPVIVKSRKRMVNLKVSCTTLKLISNYNSCPSEVTTANCFATKEADPLSQNNVDAIYLKRSTVYPSPRFAEQLKRWLKDWSGRLL